MLIDALIGLNIIIPITIKISYDHHSNNTPVMTESQIRHELAKIIAYRFSNSVQQFADWFNSHMNGCKFVSSYELHNVIGKDLDSAEHELRTAADDSQQDFYWSRCHKLQSMYGETASPVSARRWYVYDSQHCQYRPVSTADLVRIKRLVGQSSVKVAE